MIKCPKCGRDCDSLLALSRRDNKTRICDSCGIQEAIEDFSNYKQQIQKTKKEEMYEGETSIDPDSHTQD